MKKWTVVIEITDDSTFVTREMVDEFVSNAMRSICNTDTRSSTGFQIFEICEAPYGPQHPDGVFLKESKISTTSEIHNREDYTGNSFGIGRAGRVKTSGL